MSNKDNYIKLYLGDKLTVTDSQPVPRVLVALQ